MGIAKSIAKWTGSNFSKEAFDEYVIRTHTSDIQRIRGRKGGYRWKKVIQVEDLV
jgi:hypothetical protein